MSFQQVLIVGNVGRDPEFKFLSDGLAVCTFSVAVNKWVGRGEAREQRTTWFNVTMWRSLAENAGYLITSGMRVLIVGEVSARAYLTKDGKPAAALEIVARDFKVLSRKTPSEADSGVVEEGLDFPF